MVTVEIEKAGRRVARIIEDAEQLLDRKQPNVLGSSSIEDTSQEYMTETY